MWLGGKVSRKELRTGARLALQVLVVGLEMLVPAAGIQKYHTPAEDRPPHSWWAWTISNSEKQGQPLGSASPDSPERLQQAVSGQPRPR